ncbi:stemmadenine O-acetyltransferase-like [Tripterygium wilfordii]|uniref:stemmadenine O-acetyltransferase-like n=1 Tax=Tripterygium wilfordii TaxID=458696 RepID=UPI0018F81499|nr:stemmadenine O-acetyltransferase-like [Tripterygium wilfordii]
MASATMKVEIVSKETIKPSSPTPSNLTNFQLSLLDQFFPATYIHSILFYPVKNDTNQHVDVKKRCQDLKTSLSKTLTMYYPFAGRIKDHISIDCNDEGATFIETRVNCHLSDVLRNPNFDQFKEFQPLEVELPAATGTCTLLFVQTNFFECGGMAIGVRLVHKIADATTFMTFMKIWGSIAREADEVVHPELFTGAILFPPVEYKFPSIADVPLIRDESCVLKRLLFTASNIDALKAKIASAGVQQPTRVEAITALIWKCAMTASRSIKGTCSRPSSCTHAVNLRKRLSTPLSEYSVGNILTPITTEFSETEIELQSFVLKLRKELKELKVNREEISDNMKKILETTSLGKGIGAVDAYTFSSWCRMPVYEADFGWGKPTWISFINFNVPNKASFVDTKEGDGIEAWVSLREDEMAIFEHNEELLSFASVNPIIQCGILKNPPQNLSYMWHKHTDKVIDRKLPSKVIIGDGKVHKLVQQLYLKQNCTKQGMRKHMESDDS